MFYCFHFCWTQITYSQFSAEFYLSLFNGAKASFVCSKYGSIVILFEFFDTFLSTLVLFASSKCDSIFVANLLRFYYLLAQYFRM